MNRPLDTQTMFDVLNDAIDHVKARPNHPVAMQLDDVPMLADLIRIVAQEHGAVLADEKIIAAV